MIQDRGSREGPNPTLSANLRQALATLAATVGRPRLASLREGCPPKRVARRWTNPRERNTRAARRIPRDLWRVVQRKLKLLHAAGRLEDLLIPAGNRLEAVKGNQRGRHSIRVNDQYRMTFQWESGHAYEVCVEDYH